MAILLACLSSVFFGTGLVTAKFGMRHVDARSGAAMSVPTAALFFAAVSVFALDLGGFDLRAAAIFAAVGVFFPAAVTLLLFVSADRLGPALSGTISSTSPLFGIVAAWAILGEPVPPHAMAATLGIVGGVATMSWGRNAIGGRRIGWLVALPVAAALIRAVAQVFGKLGLALWPDPLAAALFGYLASAIVLTGADRLRRDRRPGPRPPRAVALFALTGLLNGIGLLLVYMALQRAPVALVVPIVAASPLVTLALVAMLVREEVVGWRSLAGALLTLVSVVYLVAG